MIAQTAACFLCEFIGRRPLLIGYVAYDPIRTTLMRIQRLFPHVCLQRRTRLNVLLGHGRGWESWSRMSLDLGHLLRAVRRADRLHRGG
jgi:hypothetical protein